MDDKISKLEQKLSQKEQEIEDILRKKENPESTQVGSLNANNTADNNIPKEDASNKMDEILIKDPWVDDNQAPSQDKDKSTPVLLEFNKRLKEDPRLQTVVLPIRDGLTLSRVV